jgi:cytosine/creatinine deaminase
VRAALRAGVDLLGGAPHSAPDPKAEMERLMTLADEAGVGLDLHTDEQLEPGLRGLADLAAVAGGRNVTASHCVALGVMPEPQRAAVIAAVAASGIGVVALPATNLYLQGTGYDISPPRGITAVRDLLAAGVPLAAGSDNVRDPFNPVGRADPLEAASLLVTAAHLTLEEAYAAISTGARKVLGLPVAGPEVGAVADILAIRATSLSDAIGRAPQDRIVIRRGIVVSRTAVSRWTAPPFA